ncbi:MAG TPA: response regulator transcription factor [Bacteroidota bacterium]|nr:response regulator transcription factor [Bacteroidota bacterium]
MKKIRLIFADDHSVVRNGLRSLFKSSKDFSIVGEANDGEAAIAIASERNPDVVILDISMPKLNGIEATKLLKQRFPAMKVLILTIHEDEAYINQMIRAGANGYILKNAEKNEILAAVRTVVNEGSFFGPDVSKMMIDKFIQRARTDKEEKVPSDQILTKREIEVLGLISQGLSNRQIADKLSLSLNTINTHRANIMQRLDIHETATLVRYALQHGFADSQGQNN